MNQENIVKKYKDLPQDIRDAIFSVDFGKTTQTIAKKYGLLIDKMGILAEEIGSVMLGISHPRDFITILQKRLEVEPEKARQIAQDVNSMIFSKVRESLKKIHQIEEERGQKAEIQKPAPPESLPIEEKKEVSPRPEKQTELAETPTTPPLAEPPKEPGAVFEQKLQQEIHQAPTETKEITEEKISELEKSKQQKMYPGGKDPYRETVE